MPSSLDVSVNEYKKGLADDDYASIKTPRALIDRGMCVCDKCGLVTSIDYKYCKNCNEIILIVT